MESSDWRICRGVALVIGYLHIFVNCGLVYIILVYPGQFGRNLHETAIPILPGNFQRDFWVISSEFISRVFFIFLLFSFLQLSICCPVAVGFMGFLKWAHFQPEPKGLQWLCFRHLKLFQIFQIFGKILSVANPSFLTRIQIQEFLFHSFIIFHSIQQTKFGLMLTSLFLSGVNLVLIFVCMYSSTLAYKNNKQKSSLVSIYFFVPTGWAFAFNKSIRNVKHWYFHSIFSFLFQYISWCRITSQWFALQ